MISGIGGVAQPSIDYAAISLSERTGQPIEKIEKDMDRDYFLSAQEALKYGIIDKVITSL